MATDRKRPRPLLSRFDDIKIAEQLSITLAPIHWDTDTCLLSHDLATDSNLSYARASILPFDYYRNVESVCPHISSQAIHPHFSLINSHR